MPDTPKLPPELTPPDWAVEVRNSGLAGQIEADLLGREASSRRNIVPCRVCGFTYVYKGRRGDLNGNFCSEHCQAWYDEGKPAIEHNAIAVVNKVRSTHGASSLVRPAL